MGNVCSMWGVHNVWAKQFLKKRWFICMGMVVLLWAGMLLYIQGESFCSGYPHGWVFQKFLVRALLDFLFALSLSLMLPRVVIFLAILLNAVCGLGLIIYARYFYETMSVFTLFTNFHDGIVVTNAVVSLIPFGSLFLFLIILIACGVLLFLAGTPPVLFRTRLTGTACCFTIYLILITTFSQFHDIAFRALIHEKETGDLTIVYGYLPVWTAELLLKNETVLCHAALKQSRTDQLTPLETPLELPRQIVVVQVETLDFTIIERKFNEKIVTPFLNELKKQSFFYKVNTFHYHGSADADFAFLARREPSRHLLNYKIKTYPYDDALPHKFNECGYKNYSFHNANRLYFNRHSAFQKMGITDINFIEDMITKYNLQTELIYGWNAVQDDVLFRIVSENVHAEKNKSFFFVITLIGHVPFTAITEQGIFPNPTSPKERYANTIHVMDRQFRTFYESLPDGTMVIVYGDHSSNIASPEYTSRDSEGDYTPCMISIVGKSIANQQKTDPLFALSGQLSLVDIANYLWEQLQQVQE
ncbi:MAG: sulfatase-like hydrolase/transferase [Planctomycetaceae bacterium]|nr:sulfatase-like hydrolase/transferase [Planctomycetaceae bacterium]